jgi:site-specific recombinase XerD
VTATAPPRPPRPSDPVDREQLEALVEALIEEARQRARRVVRTRSGDAYKPSAVRTYRQALKHRVLPTLGNKRLTAISQAMLQDFADQLAAAGLSASSVGNTILPLRAIYRRAFTRGEVALNPTLKTGPTLRPRTSRQDRGS